MSALRLRLLLFTLLGTTGAASAAIQTSLADYAPKADGLSDDTVAFEKCFAAVNAAGGGVVTIPPGNYRVAGMKPVALCSNTSVIATGARFLLPDTLGDRAQIVLFEGHNVSHFSWQGGEFIGHCFDHKRPPNTWEPNVTTRMIVLTTTAEGSTEDILFRDVHSNRVAGAVISVYGAPKPGSESEVTTYATNVTLDNCTLLESGKFMWDYGLLWQILIWPEDYQPADVAMAQRYFRNDTIRASLKLDDGGDEVHFDNSQKTLPVSKTAEPGELVCFYGDALPNNVVRGKGYCVAESSPEGIKISETPGGEPIRFEGPAGPNVKLMHNMMAGYYGLYAPTGSGPGKGAFDLVACNNVRVTGCKISALGDTMHIQRSQNIIFANNHIVGSRMGAFFLAEYCKNSTITGNLVDGGNGSRVISVEKSNEDVTMTGNTFRNGGRGSWINQPKNLVLQGNIFINNTTKGEADPWRGRRSYQTGGYLHFPELYFTLYEPDGKYGPVVIKDNLFTTGPEASDAITFSRNGSNILVEGNAFSGHAASIVIEHGVQNIRMHDNLGAKTRQEKPGEMPLMYRGRPVE